MRRRHIVALMGALALLGSLTAPAAAYPRPGATERVSVASDGSEGEGDSVFAPQPSVSADGRYVAFISQASNLVPGDTNGVGDVFVHDRQSGVTERVSVASDGTEGNDLSTIPAISADGRYVAFHSRASNLVPGDTNGTTDVFVHDRQTGVTERVSVASDGTEGNAPSFRSAISADGRFVAFQSEASNLVAGDENGTWDVFVHDRESGEIERVSVASDGTEGNDWSTIPAISADGRHVAFRSNASNLVPNDQNGHRDVFVHDRETGVTERVSVASDGTEGNDWSIEPAISADARYVAFESKASNLVPTDQNGTAADGLWDVFVHDRESGETERVSVASDGREGNSPSFRPTISADGRYVAFISWASNLVPGDTNRVQDVFVHDRQSGATERVSIASDGTEGNGWSLTPAISADGRFVAFSSEASNLVPGDTNGAWDVFLRDRGPAIGIEALAVTRAGDGLTVSGRATFSGVTVASVEDPQGDGLDPAGAEIVGASVTSRPEQEDLLLRIRLHSLPHAVARSCPGLVCVGVNTGGGAPGILYRWSFTVSETAYEVRALRAAATADPPTANPYFGLYECAATCTETVRLSGGIGTTGAEVRVSVPLKALGVTEGADLTQVQASAALGEAAPGGLEVLDEVELPDASIPLPRVEVGIAPPSASQAEVPFSGQAELTEGRLSATLEASSLSPGTYRVWARACLGETCGARSVEVTL